MSHETGIEDYVAGGGRLSSPDNAPPRYRGEIMRLIAVFVDSEMAGAAGFADAINLAPGIRERITAARIVLEKYSHAGEGLKLMEDFGANTARYVNHHPWANRLDRSADLGTRRVEGDMRLNVFHYPLHDWCDAVTMNTLMGIATEIQLGELAECSYQPLCDTMARILPVERRHAELGFAGLERLLDDGHDRVAAQACVNYWYPRVGDTFGRLDSDRFQLYRRFGLRHHSNDELHATWRRRCAETLSKVGLSEPDTTDSNRS
ncbi:MAG: phenylacetic acid catabolic [Proteobacteria bacterium]|nr:MAG: phenylacetic acid catabolic [Pseudomonadota bacterium]